MKLYLDSFFFFFIFPLNSEHDYLDYQHQDLGKNVETSVPTDKHKIFQLDNRDLIENNVAIYSANIYSSDRRSKAL